MWIERWQTEMWYDCVLEETDIFFQTSTCTVKTQKGFSERAAELAHQIFIFMFNIPKPYVKVCQSPMYSSTEETS